MEPPDDLGTMTLSSTGALFRLARQARDRAATESPQAMVAIVFAAAGAEATMSDLVVSLQNWVIGGNPLAAEAKVAAGILRFPEVSGVKGITRRVNNFRRAFGHDPLDSGEEPMQSWKQLFLLRNRVVHLQPEEVMTLDAIEDSVGALVKKFMREGLIAASPTDRLMPALSSLNTPRVAGWCVEQAEALSQHIVGLLPSGPFRQSVAFITSIARGEDRPTGDEV